MDKETNTPTRVITMNLIDTAGEKCSFYTNYLQTIFFVILLYTVISVYRYSYLKLPKGPAKSGWYFNVSKQTSNFVASKKIQHWLDIDVLFIMVLRNHPKNCRIHRIVSWYKRILVQRLALIRYSHEKYPMWSMKLGRQ